MPGAISGAGGSYWGGFCSDLVETSPVLLARVLRDGFPRLGPCSTQHPVSADRRAVVWADVRGRICLRAVDLRAHGFRPTGSRTPGSLQGGEVRSQ